MKILGSRKHACGDAANSRSISNRLLSSLMTDNSRGNLRKKQRDYTIPVRLNQQLSSPCSTNKLTDQQATNVNIFILKEQVKTTATVTTEQRQENQILGSARYIQYLFDKYQRNVKRQAFIKMPASSLNSNKEKTSFKSDERVKQISNNQISIKVTLMVIAIASYMLITSMSKLCYCDTIYKINNKSVNNKNDNQNALHNIHASIEAQHGNLLRQNNVHDKFQSISNKQLGSTNSNSVNHKENLLSYLTDNIERQHFKNPLKPVRAFVHQRPSKFDSGDDLSEEASDTSPSFSINRFRAFSNRNSSTSNRHSNIDKADEGLRQIMMMHEHALPPMTNGQKQQQQQESGSSKTSNPVANLAVRLREFSRGPARVASSLINPNKMMSNVLSYISPLVSAKFTNTTSNGPKLNFNPFVGRSNNQVLYSSAAKNLMSSALSSDYPSSPASSSSQSKHSSSVTTLPQTSFLAKPTDNVDKANGRQYNPTQATISLNNLGDTVLKSALIKPNISPKDLLMSESLDSYSHSTNSISTASGKSINESSRKQHSESDHSSNDSNSRNLLRPLISSHSGSSWLRDNANKVAQSYIQDSFRGLLTLSQLPILQAGPISTAPSVLEKGSKLKDSNKQPGSSGSSTAATSNGVIERTRAIDELYRYAYILGTGVRRKRDPLTALGSSSSASKLAHSALTSRKGVFSQRSRNQFTANSPTSTTQVSNKQLIDYAKSLRSILSTGAKPRGVMWDMATDPSLAVTVFHLLERASVALPLGR